MKADIHPKYNNATKVTCACGAVRTIGSVLPDIEVEICSSCHPFFTGEQKIMDTAGRVDKFKKRAVVSSTLAPKKKKVVVRKSPVADTKVKAAPKKKVVEPKAEETKA